MSFSPYSTMITACVCFNSRVQLTVPSFTAWLRSRYSKTLFIVLRWPAQEKDKSVCQGCHLIKNWAGWVCFVGSATASAPGRSPQVTSPSILRPALLAPPIPPHPTPSPGGSSEYQKLHRSRNQMDRVRILVLLPSSCVRPESQPPHLENGSFNRPLTGIL